MRIFQQFHAIGRRCMISTRVGYSHIHVPASPWFSLYKVAQVDNVTWKKQNLVSLNFYMHRKEWISNEQQRYSTKRSLDEEDVSHPTNMEEKSLVLVPGQEKEEETEKQSLRDRIFSRFSGSTFMKQALYAKERIAERVDESDNPIVLLVRNIYDRLFGETEMGQVIREIRQVDPQFTLSEFVRQIERETAPRILNAYLRGDRETLKELCTEDAYRALSASIREREAAGLVMDTNILDISQVEVMTGKFLQGFPVMIVTFAAQQINCIRNLSNKVIEGSEDDIRAVHYIWAMVRDIDLPSEESHTTFEQPTTSSETSCWKLMEMVVRTSYSTI
ncbi:Mitochondrial import inner membrane translocase subunit TIM44-2 [Galdieria sulphuraria]|nr:Mitochondrial import inner membrane translocase subunit TIM44-2 [Galdieria sulphuraria]